MQLLHKPGWHVGSKLVRSRSRLTDRRLKKACILSTLTQDLRRPFAVTLLACLVLTITIFHLVRFVYAITWWRFLTALHGNPPLLIALTGLFGLLVGAALFWGLWIGHPRAPFAARILIPAYLALQWVEQLLAMQRGSSFENWPFMAAISAIVIVFTYWTLSASGAKQYFGELHEQSQEDRGPSQP